MKKVILIYLICIIGLFFLPVLMVKECKAQKNIENHNETNQKLKLLMSETGEVVEISLDEYIMGVLVGEMPVNYELEALKAQAVVARTYTLNKLVNSPDAHDNADMCDDINHCQAYKTKEYALACWEDNEENKKWNKIKTAVTETADEVITYRGELINAFFHADSGGRTEDIVNIWGHEDIPYLKSVESIESQFLDKVTLSIKEIDKIMKNKYNEYVEIDGNPKFYWDEKNNISGEIVNKKSEENSNEGNDSKSIESNKEIIEILEKNSSGRVSKIRVSNITLEGTEARTLFSLRSTKFNVNKENENIIFETIGYGHGIGMSQNGANAMALSGSSYKEIITHYYTDTKIEKISVD